MVDPLREYPSGRLSRAEVQSLIDTALGEVGGASAAEDVSYSNALIEGAGGTAADVKDALDFILQALRDTSIIGAVIASWDGVSETDLVTPEGVTFLNGTYDPNDGPAEHPAIYLANTHANPILALSGLAVGTRIRVTSICSGISGGGTLLNLVVQSGTTTLDCQSTTWTSRTATVTVGANGLFTLSASWQPRFATMLIEDLGIA